LSDRYARFLIEKILPEVGKTYNLSKNPNDRATAGLSSGAIAAFTVAWDRPDAFRRVMSFIGSYTDLRGGDIYAALIRKTEPKPLRIFLQDGSNDLNLYAGHWWMANQTMASALQYAGYEVRFVRGTGGHEARHGGSIFPDALRWVWQGYPAPVRKSTERGAGERHFITEILDPASEWELVGDGYTFTEGPAVDRQGNVFFVDVEAPGRISRVAPGGKTGPVEGRHGQSERSDVWSRRKALRRQGDRKRIAAYTAEGTESAFADGIRGNDLAVTSRGGVYVTEPATRQVWYIDPSSAKRVVNERSLVFPNGVLLSPEEALLYVADTATKWVWSFHVLADGSLANAEPFFRMEMPEESGNGPLRSGADGMTVDTEGYLYVATKLGVQICDQPGRVVGIISPASKADISNVVFAGPDMQWLYVTEGDKVFRRHLRRKGVFPWAPVKPPQPRL
jgi:sugar lactone lactonase YvrE